MTRIGLVTWILFAATSAAPVYGQQWARKMFKETEHDFGTVARGAKSEFHFVLQNLYEEDIHIASVRSSCGCTEPRIEKDSLKTWEKGAIICAFNTRSFLGHRSATVTVTIDKPYYAEVQLNVRGYIRSDVVFTPGSIDLGQVPMGKSVEQKVNVAFVGRSSWAIEDVQSTNPAFEVELGKAVRSGSRVNYEMLFRLREDAPAGYIQDQITIVSNDLSNRTIPLAVEGHVVSPLTVSPASLFVGVVGPGDTVTKKLLVRGNEPFEILGIDCDDAQFSFDIPDKQQKLHFIPVKFQAGNAPGRFVQEITIRTSLGDASVGCSLGATIRDDSSNSSSK